MPRGVGALDTAAPERRAAVAADGPGPLAQVRQRPLSRPATPAVDPIDPLERHELEELFVPMQTPSMPVRGRSVVVS